ncbi:MAG: chalcone isomerase family protein [Bdellovibrionales bacterium]
MVHLLKSFLTVLILTFTATSQAAFILNLELDPSKAINKVKIAKSAMTNTSQGEAPIAFTGAGTRIKTVFVDVKVYVAQLFVSNLSQFQRTEAGALPSLDDSGRVAIHITFLRDIDAAMTRTSLTNALARNHVNTQRKEFTDLLNAIESMGNATKGDQVAILSERQQDGTEFIMVDNYKGTQLSVVGPAGFARDFFSIWLGIVKDSDLKLKRNLIGIP